MIDIAKLKELVGLMTSNDLTEVEIKGDKESVTIKRASPTTAPVVHYAAAPSAMANVAAPAVSATPTVVASATASIDSPMVGTFYASPNPDAGLFVKAGQAVSPDTVVCIIEAMKVFNEIKAEKAGVIESMMVKNGQSVEFGQKLYSLK